LRDIQRVKEAKEEAERIKSGKPIEKGKKSEASAMSPSSRLTSLEEGSLEKISSGHGSSDALPREEEVDPPIPIPPTPTAAADRTFSALRVSSPPPTAPAPLSEKARGKMKEGSGASIGGTDLDPELERVAAAGVGRNGFVPTHEWVASWQQGLPLDTVLLLIAEVLPKVHEIQSSAKPSNTTSSIIEYLKLVDLRNVLPPPSPVVPRRFQWTDASLVWLSSLIWGEIFVKGTSPLAIWNSTNVRLFGVKHTSQPRSMTNFVGGLLGTAPPPSNAQNSSLSHGRRMSRQI